MLADYSFKIANTPRRGIGYEAIEVLHFINFLGFVLRIWKWGPGEGRIGFCVENWGSDQVPKWTKWVLGPNSFLKMTSWLENCSKNVDFCINANPAFNLLLSEYLQDNWTILYIHIEIMPALHFWCWRIFLYVYYGRNYLLWQMGFKCKVLNVLPPCYACVFLLPLLYNRYKVFSSFSIFMGVESEKLNVWINEM